MIQDQVKKELDQRGWSILKLSQETGIRYPSLTEWFKDKKGLDSTNLEKIIKTLDLEIMKRTSGSRMPDYINLVKNFKGNGKYIHCETEMEIEEDEIAAFFFGVIAQSAGNYLQKEAGSFELSYGNIFDKLIAERKEPNRKAFDVQQSLLRKDFVRIASTYFNEKERDVVSMLLMHDFSKTDSGRIDTQFLAGFFKDIKFE